MAHSIKIYAAAPEFLALRGFSGSNLGLPLGHEAAELQELETRY